MSWLAKRKTKQMHDQTPEQEMKVRTRRGFLALGLGAVAGIAGWEWLRHGPDEGGLEDWVDLEKLANGGDATARRLYDFAAGHLALAIANQVSVLNPGVLVLGGGVLSRSPGMVERIRQAVASPDGVG